MRRLIRSIYATLPFRRQAYAMIRRLGIVPSFYQHLHFKGPFELAIDDRRSIRLLSTGNIVENELFWLGFGNGWEGTSLKLWRRICDGADGVMLDIGANSGVYALVAARLAPAARVIAFEPIARVAAQLRRNVALNDLRVVIEQQAVSDQSGSITMFDDPVAFNYSASIEGQGPDAQRIEVPVCTIDGYLANDPPARLTALKIDIERHEPKAIAGMKQSLKKHRPAILIEILDEQIGAAVDEQISGLGYRKFHIVERKGLVPTDRLAPLSGDDWNHLLCTQEQFDRFSLAEFLYSGSSKDK